MTVRSLCSGGFLALLLLLLSSPVSAQSLRPTSSTLDASFKSLDARATRDGSVRVIVGVTGDYQAEGRLASGAKSRQRQVIAFQQEAVLKSLGAPKGVTRFETVPFVALEVSPEDLARLQASPHVVSVQLDEAVPAHDMEPALMNESTVLIGADVAWASGFDGTGYEVAILDTGVQSAHPFLDGQVVAGACFSGGNGAAASFCTEGAAFEIGISAGAECSNASWGPGCDHGTHVAGTAAGARGVSGAPVGGVAPGAGIVALQVFSGFTDEASCGVGAAPCALSYTSDQMLALEHILRLVVDDGRQIASANMSLGGGNQTATCDSDARKSIIDNLASVGVATVISSGNDGFQAATGAPGCISTAVTVGSSTKTDAVSGFSNIAPWMDVFAPGTAIVSSVPGGYSSYNGTSMAAPHVAGAWAVLKQANPTESVEALLTRFTSTGVGISAGSPAATFPRIQVDAALALPSPEAVVSPGSISFSLAEGGTAERTVTVSNVASGAYGLTYTARLANYTGPVTTRAKNARATECVGGQTVSQVGSVNIMPVAPAGPNLGQSFTAPCDGRLTILSPEVYGQASGSAGQTWNATLRIYQGSGTSGTLLATAPVTHTNTDFRETVVVTLPEAVEVSEGATYTWFLDITSGETVQWLSDPGTYAGGASFYSPDGTPAAAFEYTPFDVDFTATFDAPEGWGRLSASSGAAASGASSAFDLSVDATGLAEGTHTADLILTTNDPDAATLTIDVTLNVGAVAGTVALDGDPGWYLLSSPSAVTVDDLAEMNLVAGVRGYYPDFGVATYGVAAPTLYTDYDGTSWSAASGAGDALTPGMGFLWYFFDDTFTPEEPTTNASAAVSFPVTLSAPEALHSEAVTVSLHNEGNRFNMLGNPYGVDLDVSSISSWEGGNKLASKGRVYIWDAATSGWSYGETTVAPWQGFAVRTKRNSTGDFTIPQPVATSRPTVNAEASPLLAFELEGEEAGTGRVLLDRALSVGFEDEALAGTDDLDADKLAPLASAFVSLGVQADDALRAYEARPSDAATFEVPLVLQTAGAGETLTLRWHEPTQLPAEWTLSLRDAVTGATIDLREQTEYTFRAPRSPQLSMGGGLPPLEVQATSSSARFALRVETGRAAQPEEAVALNPVHPNPARGAASVSFSLAEPGDVSLTVVDLLGRVVQTLHSGRSEAGLHASTIATEELASGVYVVRLHAAQEVRVQRLTIIR